MRSGFRAALSVSLVVGCAPSGNQPSSAAETELPLRHSVNGSTLSAGIGLVDRIQLDPAYRYIGGQRFILQNTADAEQHVFADVDSAGKIRRLYWIQFEEMLKDRKGAYDYSPDTVIMISGLPLWVNAARHSSAPRPGSDREALNGLLERAGLHPPLPATRVRLVYIPDGTKRSELMVIYAEASESTAQPPASEATAAIRRATTGGLRYVMASAPVNSGVGAATAARGCGDEFIGDEGMGKVYIGAPIDSVRAVCTVIRDTTKLATEGQLARKMTIRFPSDTIVAEIVKGRVWRIEVTSPKFRTRDSLGVGTPLDRLLKLEEPRGLSGEGRLFVVSPDHCGLSFGLSKNFPGALPRPIDRAALGKLPRTTTVRNVFIIGCPND